MEAMPNYAWKTHKSSSKPTKAFSKDSVILWQALGKQRGLQNSVSWPWMGFIFICKIPQQDQHLLSSLLGKPTDKLPCQHSFIFQKHLNLCSSLKFVLMRQPCISKQLSRKDYISWAIKFHIKSPQSCQNQNVFKATEWREELILLSPIYSTFLLLKKKLTEDIC